ncbi:hypothetical protein TTHERM_01431550 (macronuclear) [Tetrahymena thermophila SB210]|uniref:Uncharacterized protein n=1 Tax=Tetrahymena thermophila (strain SB210) TaxID=312017 RepID=Q24JG7_TETTS|nr:hypothetical protein TTHERM_01431550 [Tetrahymena thermophila SB210]EAS07924.1 hypothetical protein TTHERM_01431550 [Tetrahymena thermophila SB210]|eukprot:XP_001028166.1 hypothetical protein TTHERM_01431550 [Tetrahymena thermophila SB210]
MPSYKQTLTEFILQSQKIQTEIKHSGTNQYKGFSLSRSSPSAAYYILNLSNFNS